MNDYLAYLHPRNPQAATHAVAEFDAAGEKLARHPFIGRVGRDPTTREFSRPRWSKIIVYEVFDDRVAILMLLDPRQDI